jgi:tetratricopeptide (TPR) repeat protein
VIEQILQADRYLQVDQVERARDMYQRVVDMDPGNAIAVVGLARCALADGSDEQAYVLASRALDIDPENDMARRMEARLSEILTSRGQTVQRPAAAAIPAPREMRAVVTDEAPASQAAAPGGADATPAPQASTPALQAAATEDQPPPAAKPPGHPSTSTRSPKERPVRKSLFDRLMGR